MTKKAQIAAILAVGMFAAQGCGVTHTGQGGAPPVGIEPQAVSSQVLGSAAAVATKESRYFEATGQAVSQPFLDYWEKNGGLAVFGYPVSHRIKETDEATGERYTAQYFERARLELHPSTGDQVILGRLGALLHPTEPPTMPRQGDTYFKETGHNVPPAFARFWNDHGGLILFGYPITEVLTQRDRSDGKDYQVQYFERARFELHPELAGTEFEVQLGRLGREAYAARSQ